MACFDCGSFEPTHDHHVVPRSLGGTSTVPLCERCHGLVHGRDLRIAALTSAALQHKRAKGEKTGGAVPYGYRLAADGVRLVAVEAEQTVIEAARAYRAAGLSLRKVAARLAADGHTSRTGRAFASEQIRRMLGGEP